ncbi:hypothetical protein ACS0TY_014244 [Phlomoides rotata]
MFYLSYSILFDSTRAFLTEQLKSSLLVLVLQLMRAFLTAQLKSSLLVLVLQLMRGMKEKTNGPSPDTKGISDSTTYILVARFGASADEMTVIRGIVKGNEGKMSGPSPDTEDDSHKGDCQGEWRKKRADLARIQKGISDSTT